MYHVALGGPTRDEGMDLSDRRACCGRVAALATVCGKVVLNIAVCVRLVEVAADA